MKSLKNGHPEEEEVDDYVPLPKKYKRAGLHL